MGTMSAQYDNQVQDTKDQNRELTSIVQRLTSDMQVQKQ